MKNIFICLLVLSLMSCTSKKNDSKPTTTVPVVVPKVEVEGYDYPFNEYTTYVCSGNSEYIFEILGKENFGTDDYFWLSLRKSKKEWREPDNTYYFGLGIYKQESAGFGDVFSDGYGWKTTEIANYQLLENHRYKVIPWNDIYGEDSTKIPLYFEFKEGKLYYPVAEDLSYKNTCEIRIPNK